MLCERKRQQRLFKKYDSEFCAHFANSVNELLYEGIHTPSRIAAKDTLEYTEVKECLFGYLVIPQSVLAELIHSKATGFASPTIMKTELPLMILTSTQDVFERRLKRFRKVINGEASSGDSSSISYLSSVISHSTVIFLKKNLSQLTLSQLSSQSSGSSFFGSEGFNNFESIVSSEKKSQISEERGVKTKSKTGVDSEVSVLKAIIECNQSQLAHLIFEFTSRENSLGRSSSRPLDSKSIKKQSSQQLMESEPMQEIDPALQTISDEIKSVLIAEMRKYNLNLVHPYTAIVRSNRSSSLNSGSRKKVIQKAEEMLRNLNLSITGRNQ